MVPLFHETDVAQALVARLGKLRYPRACLDILLIVEEDDAATRDLLGQSTLPPWFRVIDVPRGAVQTKPRALNYALGFCRGTILGIYDAEDAPDPDQLKMVVAGFQTGPPDLACLQGALDYYNARENWLSRCFTIEYATWFRLLLPGIARMGMVVPLGGTTVFFRREAIEAVRGWDAHNVTEDCDLGIRLARHGWRTEILPTVTREEANNRLWPWVRQRSRWLKGYMVSYAVSMRSPALLLRQLGPWRFAAFQVFFFAAISQPMLAPLMWSFWAVPLGLGHPVAGLLGTGAIRALALAFLGATALDICANVIAIRRTEHHGLDRWAPTMMFYFPLAALASYKALWELFARPFWWDKTAHGHSASAADPTT